MLPPTPPADLFIALIDEIQRMRGRLKTATAAFVDPDGPTGLAGTVLAAVVGAASPPTVPQIGRSLGYPRQTVQRQADELIARGLIVGVDNPDHKRARRLLPTQAGQAQQDRAHAASLVWAAQLMDGIDSAQLSGAVDTLRAIRARIEADARRDHAPFTDDNED